MNQEKINNTREEAYLLLLERAIDDNLGEQWYEEAKHTFLLYFSPERYRSSGLDNEVEASNAEQVFQVFLEDCPNFIWTNGQEDWSQRHLKEFRKKREALLQKMEKALTLLSIEKYLNRLEDAAIVGSGTKPGKSFLINYLQCVCELHVDVSFINNPAVIYPFKDDPHDHWIKREMPLEIFYLLEFMGIENMNDYGRRGRVTVKKARTFLKEVRASIRYEIAAYPDSLRAKIWREKEALIFW